MTLSPDHADSTVTPAAALDLPRWLEEFSLSLASHPQVLLMGNVRDVHVVDDRLLEALNPAPIRDDVDTVTACRAVLRHRGIPVAFLYDPVDGLTVSCDPAAADRLRDLIASIRDPHHRELLQRLLTGSTVHLPPNESKVVLPTLLECVTGSADCPAACLMDYAGWLAPSADAGRSGGDARTEIPDAIRKARQLCDRAQPWLAGRPAPLYNPIVWITPQQGDLPPWLIGSPRLRIVAVEPPGKATRQAYGRLALAQWRDYRALAGAAVAPDLSPEQDRVVNTLTDLTEGVSLRQTRDIVNVAKDRHLSPAELRSAWWVYRVGVVKSEWESPVLRQAIRGDRCAAALRESVKGQPGAVRKAAEIVQRAVLGLAGAESADTNPNRPKGVLFLAGPTGVGKTLMAKAIANLVFRDPDRVIRFDMAEYSEAQSEARLIGAPPGYVGYSSGGQLTDRIRQQPFSVVLFDEIEKAHSQILDKFLQILDDGRLTDGTGMTVNFSETLIVFTSNLGMVTPVHDDHRGLVFQPTMTYADRFPAAGEGLSSTELETTIYAGVRDYFLSTIRRPELLSRIGEDNIVIFDFIDRSIASDIVGQAIANVERVTRVKDGVRLELAPTARAGLLAAASTDTYLSMGGRGLKSAVATLLVNSLTRALTDRLEPDGTFPFDWASVTALTWDESARQWYVDLATG
jgi:hypothetical protein